MDFDHAEMAFSAKAIFIFSKPISFAVIFLSKLKHANNY